jgi:uncharacterized membrane protein
MELAAAQAAKGAVKIFQWQPFLAPFHAVVLHYPIGFITMACILELYSFRRPSEELRHVTRLVILLSLLSGIVAAGLGIMRAQSGGYDVTTLSRHRMFGLSIPVLTLLTLWLKHKSIQRGQHRGSIYAYRVSLLATLAVLIVAGHQGGTLTHGSNYLVQHAPEFVRDFFEEPDLESSGRDPGTNASSVYESKVRPILIAKCYQCHGSEKQKAGYRLDLRDAALKGGESELVAIKPGEPLQSNLVRLITLPNDHDDAMPPSGKEPLTPEEVMTILHWIQNGASFGEQ